MITIYTLPVGSYYGVPKQFFRPYKLSTQNKFRLYARNPLTKYDSPPLSFVPTPLPQEVHNLQKGKQIKIIVHTLAHAYSKTLGEKNKLAMRHSVCY